MKAIKIFIGSIIIILSFTPCLLAQDAQQMAISLSQPGKPYKLSVELVTGSIQVTEYDGKDIVVETQTNNREKREESYIKTDMRRIPGNGSDIIASEKNNVVTIGAAVPHRNTNFTIKIPRGSTNIKLTTVNGKYINADGIDGDIEVSNTNGNIKLYNVSGSVVANTVNGNVMVTFEKVNDKAAMAFTTLNGNINVTFPANLKANIKARSDKGSVHSEFDIVSDKGPATITKTSKTGMRQINVDDWIYGRIGGGGPEIMLKNLNGSIYIHKVK